MPYVPTTEDYQLIYQKNKKLTVYFELLNENMQTIDNLEGDIISGDFSSDGTSDIRRTINVTFYVRNKNYMVNENSRIWLDKMVRVKLGIENSRTHKISKYPLGLFIFTDYTFQYDAVTNSLSLTCVDFMAKFTGLRKGKLDGSKTLIPTTKGLKIRKVMIDTISQLGKIKNYLIADIGGEYPPIPDATTGELPVNLPYNLEFGTGTTIYDILVKLRDLYPNYQIYFDEDLFVCSKIPSMTNDPVILGKNALEELIISENQVGSFNDVKNCIQIFGKDNLHYTLKLVNKAPSTSEDKTFYKVNPESPYTVEKIGEVWEVFSGGEYEKIYNEQLLKDRCEYELWNATNRKIALSLDMMLVPFLDVYQKIEYRIKSSNEVHQFIINKLSFDLTGGTMNLELNNFYPLYEWL